MNLEGIKKTLAKIPAWVKANPKKAAVIGVVIVVIAYFAIKRGASDSGEELTAAPGEESLDSLGGGLSGFESSGGGSGGLGGSTDSGGSVITEVTESSGGFSGGGFGESDFSMGDIPSGFVNASPVFGGSSAAIISNPVTSFKPASEMSGVKSVLTDTGAAKSNNALVKVSAPAPVAAASKSKDVIAPAKTPVKVSTPVVSKTDAERAGLSKYYTGVYNGRRYVAGAFVGTVTTTPAAKKSNTLAARKL